MPPVGLETTISAGGRPKTYVLDRAATGTGVYLYIPPFILLSNQYQEKLIKAKV